MEKSFFTLKELSKRWNKEEEGILRIATEGELTFSLVFDGYLINGKYFVAHDKQDSFKIIHPKEYYLISGAIAVQEELAKLTDGLIEEAQRSKDGSRLLVGPYDGILVPVRTEDIVRFLVKEEVELRFVFFEGSLRTMQEKIFYYPVFNRSDLLILNEEVTKLDPLYSQLNEVSQSTEIADEKKMYITGDDEFKKAFNRSMSTIREWVRDAGEKFEYDPETRKKRLLLSSVNKIVAEHKK